MIGYPIPVQYVYRAVHSHRTTAVRRDGSIAASPLCLQLFVAIGKCLLLMNGTVSCGYIIIAFVAPFLAIFQRHKL